jgi:chaperone BCS1
MWDWILTAINGLLSNSLASGAILLSLISISGYYLKSAGTFLFYRIRRCFFAETEVRSSFLVEAIGSYLAYNTEANPRTSTYHSKSDGYFNNDGHYVCTEIKMEPGVGIHIIRFKGCRLIISKEKEKIESSIHNFANAFGMYLEYYKVSVFARNGKSILEDFLVKVTKEYEAKAMENKKIFCYLNGDHDWIRIQEIEARSFDSICLPEGLEAELNSDIELFFNSKEVYQKRGTPWRRGYLFYGPPGTGKTSLVKTLSSNHRLNLYTLSITNPELNDSRLLRLLYAVPPKSIILIEDIDEQTKFDKLANTLNGLLNGLDGVASTTGVLFILSTNNVETLDPKLIRPGRIDKKILLGNCSEFQVRKLVSIFFPDLNQEYVEQIVKVLGTESYTPSRVQQYLMDHLDKSSSSLIEDLSSFSTPEPAK